ncbi:MULTISPECIES: rhomboid family intramembrane serine protease [Pseudofrankia]|uniref:rhomboid family intramembrane serine protease n=1 Tax=Pseudofrankia TaxID=2994363 RepID=UPI000234C310|nr:MULTISPECIES: rhomboid family intramembrane serine protease [Pseudofrankia]
MTAQGIEPEPAAGSGRAASGTGDAGPGHGAPTAGDERSPWARPTGAGEPPAESAPAASPGQHGHPGWGTPPGPPPAQVSWGAPRVDGAAPDGPAQGGPGQGARPGGGGNAGQAPGSGPSGQQTRCYRHPEREAYVFCQRCGRPICPDCMRPASVGFHCPEEQGASPRPQRQPRTALGGRAQASSGLVTKILIGLCLVAYVLQGVPGLTGTSRINQFTIDYSLIGVKIALDDEYWRLVTAAFLHGSVLHILFNMYALFLLGTQLEAVLGRARYLALFFACAIGGNTLSYLMSGERTFSYGASTAIFGFFAAYYLIARRLRLNTNQILIVVGINLVITFTISGIDKWGHLGGLGTGLLLGLLYAYVPSRRVALQALGTGAVVAVLLVAAVLNSQSLTSMTGG